MSLQKVSQSIAEICFRESKHHGRGVILFLGESVHGASEFPAAKQSIIAELVAVFSKVTVVLEMGHLEMASYPNVGSAKAAEQFLTNNSFGIFQTREYADMLQWLAALRSTGKVDFYGMDCRIVNVNDNQINRAESYF